MRQLDSAWVWVSNHYAIASQGLEQEVLPFLQSAEGEGMVVLELNCDMTAEGNYYFTVVVE